MVEANELARIVPIAAAHGVDPLFIYTIRRVEDGGPGREFGVLSVSAPTWEAQCAVACNSVTHRMNEFDDDPDRTDGVFALGRRRLAYSNGFIDYFATIWAPIGADNDPNGLNANWAKNARAIYQELCAKADEEAWL